MGQGLGLSGRAGLFSPPNSTQVPFAKLVSQNFHRQMPGLETPMKLRLKSVVLAGVVISSMVALCAVDSIAQTGTLTVSPGSLSFGNQALLTTSTAKIVTLKAGTPI